MISEIEDKIKEVESNLEQDEKPAEEKPAEESPAEEKPAEEAVTEEKPAPTEEISIDEIPDDVKAKLEEEYNTLSKEGKSNEEIENELAEKYNVDDEKPSSGGKKLNLFSYIDKVINTNTKKSKKQKTVKNRRRHKSRRRT